MSISHHSPWIVVSVILFTGCDPAGTTESNKPESVHSEKATSTEDPASETLKLCGEMEAAIERSRSANVSTAFSDELRIAEFMVGMSQSMKLEDVIKERIKKSEQTLDWIERGKFIRSYHQTVTKLLPPLEVRRPDDIAVASEKVTENSPSETPADIDVSERSDEGHHPTKFTMPVQVKRPDIFLREKVEVLSGRRITDMDTNGIMIDQWLSAKIQKDTGDIVVINGGKFQILGVFKESAEPTDSFLIANLPEVERNTYELTLENNNTYEPTSEKIVETASVRSNTLQTPLGQLPDHFHDIHLDFLLQILEKHRPELAERLRQNQLQDSVQFVLRFCGNRETDFFTGKSTFLPPEGGKYDHTCDVNFDTTFKDEEFQVEDPFKFCADYVARYTYEVADPKERLETIESMSNTLVEGETAKVQTAWQTVFNKPMQEQVNNYTLGSDEHPLQTAYPLVKKHLPDEAAEFAEFVRKWHQFNQGAALHVITESVLELHRVEQMFREVDIDQNGVHDYWTADVAGLFRLKVNDQPLSTLLHNHTNKSLYWDSIESSDASPVVPVDASTATTPVYNQLRYLFQAVRLDPEGNPYGQDTDKSGHAWRNASSFAVCAFPRSYPHAGRQTYLISEKGVLWFKDTEGQPVEQFPKDPDSDGWQRAVKQPETDSEIRP